VLLKGVLAQHLCKRLGGDGRVAVQEILLHTYAVANMIRENKVHQIDAYLQSAENAGTGMQSLDTALLDLVRGRVIAGDTALRLASTPDTLRQQIREIPED
jgi:twitching motility protein PilT